jgi:hypothetical protein
MAALEYAPNMFRALNGVFCIFKPKGVSMKGVRMGLKKRLANGKHQTINPNIRTYNDVKDVVALQTLILRSRNDMKHCGFQI